MNFYIAMSNRTDLAAIEAEARAGQRPRHAAGQLASALSATVLAPERGSGTRFDRLLSRLVGTPETWALARRLRALLKAGDVVFCADEAVGIPVAALCGGRGAKVMVFGHNLVRPRARAALALFSIGKKAEAFMAVSKKQTDFLRHAYGIDDARLLTLSDQTDIRFFIPGESLSKQRPVIVSVGLEKRDYRTLAAATADLDVDVRISGFSADARVIQETFPDEMPANMTKGFYTWPDLQALYRTADIVVVSLFPNTYAAGIQGLLEAVACGRPVIVTRTEGLAEYLDRPDLITSVATGDPAQMRAAIEAKLADPAQAERQAAAAREFFLPRIDSDHYVAAIADKLRSFGART